MKKNIVEIVDIPREFIKNLRYKNKDLYKMSLYIRNGDVEKITYLPMYSKSVEERK